ncbi:dispanin subfamily A member 2b-like [Cottoperca gobio]|uniref:Dispanin subfamily A member 2b-like n=1 Tax=Cottoperca gobio TaxID=56716 RepID=A0A6J2PW66_COTGO|nr:dispanin subfamily A member 2b-like [Cottoperca gobio]
MNLAGYSSDNVPFLGRYDGTPGQPGGSTTAQYTTVNISTEPPKDHIIWSLSNFVFVNVFCLGLVALIFSIKLDRKVAGDLEGARRHGSTAKYLNISATVLTSTIVLIYIIIITSITISVQRY